jgi:hypothetical protein
MENIAQKTLEVKIRPYSGQNQERPDQKGISRVHLSREALLDLSMYFLSHFNLIFNVQILKLLSESYWSIHLTYFRA